MKKLYYVKTIITENINGVEECTGRKVIYVYEIIDNEPCQLFDIDIDIDENTEDSIDEYLIEDGQGELKYKLTEL